MGGGGAIVLPITTPLMQVTVSAGNVFSLLDILTNGLVNGMLLPTRNLNLTVTLTGDIEVGKFFGSGRSSASAPIVW